MDIGKKGGMGKLCSLQRKSKWILLSIFRTIKIIKLVQLYQIMFHFNHPELWDSPNLQSHISVHLNSTWTRAKCYIWQVKYPSLSRSKDWFHELTLLCWSEASGCLWTFWSLLYRGWTTSLGRDGWKWQREKDEQEVAAEFPRHFDDCQDAKLTFRHTAGWFVLPPSSSGEFGHHIPGPFIF